MPYEIRLAANLKQAGWKVKIFDREGPEEPPVTILQKRRKWRWSLRTRAFLDRGDKWSQIDNEVRAAIEVDATWRSLQEEWNTRFPGNLVSGNTNE